MAGDMFEDPVDAHRFVPRMTVEETERRANADSFAQSLVQAFKAVQTDPQTPQPTHFPIPTTHIVEDLLRRKCLKLPKGDSPVPKTTIRTYERNFHRLARVFPHLPLTPQPIELHLSTLDGASGRNRRNAWDDLNMLYSHAHKCFGLSVHPMASIERPRAERAPIRTLSWDATRALFATAETTEEMAALSTLCGHGWRQIEHRRVTAGDARRAVDGAILVHGKLRTEYTPILPETLDLLKRLATGLSDGDIVIRSRRIRNGSTQPLGEDGLSQMLDRLFEKAHIELNGHDLRRTFSSLVFELSGDWFLTCRLIRDKIPGCGDRYIHVPLSMLVQDLEKYSPLRHLNSADETIQLSPVSTI